MRWTKEEIEMLKKLSKTQHKLTDINKVFPYRTLTSIRNKAYSLNLSFAGENPTPDLDAFARIMKGESKCL